MNEYKYCTNCGTKNNINAKFCKQCGHEFKLNTQNTTSNQEANGPTNAREQVKQQSKDQRSSSILGNATSKLNSWTGGQGEVKISLKDFFSQVLKHHTKEEAEEIFIVGTPKTTPSIDEIVVSKVHPWLFSRILLFDIILSALMLVLALWNQRIGNFVTLDILLTISVPLAAFILFFESNILKNISFYDSLKMLFLGGVLSLILTMALDRLVISGQFDFWGSLGTGFAEELAKLLVAAYFISKLRAKSIFNGLLIGASVGTGFAMFENIVYMFDNGQIHPFTEAISRAVFSISDHTEWCAISTAALLLVTAGRKFGFEDLLNIKFLRFFIIVVLIHTCWDWQLFDSISIVRYIVLAIITWIIVFVFMHAGLREITILKQEHSNGGVNSEVKAREV